MDPVTERMRLSITSAALLLATVACEPATSPDSAPEAPPRPGAEASSGAIAPTDPYVLRVPPGQLTRVEILRQSGPKNERHITLEKGPDGWTVVSPVHYPANQTAIDAIVAVLAEIEITGSVGGVRGVGRDARRHRVDAANGIEIKAWAGGRLASEFVVGSSTREATYVRRLSRDHNDQAARDDRILIVRGRCRPLFERTLDELRHPVITDIDVADIRSVTYTSPSGRLEFVPVSEEPGRFVARGASGANIRNFDSDRASADVSVLAHLLAAGFVDARTEPDLSGLFETDTPKATIVLRAPARPGVNAPRARTVSVWVGALAPRGKLYLRTSESDQIFLVSAHLESTLVPRKSHFERSDAHMQELQALRDKHVHDEAEHTKKGTPAHAHGAPDAPVSQVTPELMKELRTLAREQRERP